MERQPRWVHKFEVKPGKWVFVPTSSEMAYGKDLVGYLERYWSFPRYYYHMREGGHVAALRSHARHRYFCCVDIKNFFGSINKSRVTRALKGRLGYARARDVANRSTVKVGSDGRTVCCLPFGFPQSPFLASLALYDSRLGKVLHALSKNPLFRVSVYVDDILISSNDLRELGDVFSEVIVAAERSGFQVHNGKTQRPCLSVTSFNVEVSHNSLSVTRDRLMLFSMDFHASSNPCEKDGILGYVESINHGQVGDLMSLVRHM